MLKLAIDIQTGNLVPWQGSLTYIPEFRQSTVDVELRFVKPLATSSFSSKAYTPIDLSGYLGPRLGLWKKCTGTLDDSGPNVLALTAHTSFTLVSDTSGDAGLYAATPDAYPYFSGTFNTWTDELAAWIGRQKSAAAYFSVALVRSDTSLEVLFDQHGGTNCTVLASSDDGTGVPPVSVVATPGHLTLTLPTVLQTSDGSKKWIWDEDPANPGTLLLTRIL